MRETFDCLLLGHTWPAALLARLLARRGGQALVLADASEELAALAPPPPTWLVASSDEADYHACARQAGLGEMSRSAEGERLIEVIGARAALPLRRCRVLRDPFQELCESLAVERGTEMTPAAAPPTSAWRWRDAAGQSRRAAAPLVVDCRPRWRRQTTPGMIVANIVLTAIYVDVNCERGPQGGDVLCFAMDRGKDSPPTTAGRARFWLLPQGSGLAALSAELDGVPVERLADPCALWEDELVGCPALAQCLLHARLVDGVRLRVHAPPPALPGVQTLAEFDHPLPFASRGAVLAQLLHLAAPRPATETREMRASL